MNKKPWSFIISLTLLLAMVPGCTKEKRPGPYLEFHMDSTTTGANPVWTSIANFDDHIYALESYGNELWIAGRFTQIDFWQNTNYVTRWNGSNFTADQQLYGWYVSDLYNHTSSGNLYCVGNYYNSGLNCVSYRSSLSSGWLGNTMDMNPTVNDLIVYGSSPVIAGTFTMFGSTNYNHVASWNGSAWVTLGNGFNSDANTVIEYNGTLYAAGTFTFSGSQSVARIARWNGVSWVPLLTGLNGPVYEMIVYNGELIVAGDFSLADFTPVNNIARWNGSTWSSLGNGLYGGNDRVGCLEVHNSKLYAGGEFSTAGSVSAQNVACWDGSNWSSVANGIPVFVNALGAHNGKLYAGTVYSSSSYEFLRLDE